MIHWYMEVTNSYFFLQRKVALCCAVCFKKYFHDILKNKICDPKCLENIYFSALNPLFHVHIIY